MGECVNNEPPAMQTVLKLMTSISPVERGQDVSAQLHNPISHFFQLLVNDILHFRRLCKTISSNEATIFRPLQY